MTEHVSRNNSVEKGLQILECFTHAHPFLTLEEIVKMTGFPKTTTFRLIKSLETYGYLRSNQRFKESQYSLGWVFLSKGNLVLSQLNIRDMAHDEMVDLRNKTGQTVQLAIRDRDEAVYIEQIESLKPIQLYPQVGRKAPLYAAACPRVLLASLTENEQDRVLSDIDFKTYTRIPKVEKLKEELERVKVNGYAISYGELHEGTIAIASPILTKDNQAVAAISVAGLEKDFENGHLETCIDLVKTAAQRLTMKLKF